MCETEDNSNEKIFPFGRVYRLVSDNGLVYVGATVQTLKRRFGKHKTPASSCEKNIRCLFENDATVKIELIKEVPNISLKDLQQLKGKYIIEQNRIYHIINNEKDIVVNEKDIVVNVDFDTWFDNNIIQVEKRRIQSSVLLERYNESTASDMQINSKMLCNLMANKGIASKKISNIFFIGIDFKKEIKMV